MSFLRGLFGKKPEGEPAPVRAIAGVDLPLGLRPGGALALDTTVFDAAGEAFGFAPPRGHNLIEAYGQIDLGAGAILHRFYLTDDAFLQVNTTAGAIDEMKYFVFHETKQPANQAAFKRWVESGSAIGGTDIDVEGRRYTRVWGDEGDTGWIPPVTFDEKVYRGRPPVLDYDLTHYCMLYQRDIAALGRTESLLVSAEDYGPSEFCVTYALGIDVTTADLDIT
jgi:hypothetical protein